jgi:hypothetical protein
MELRDVAAQKYDIGRMAMFTHGELDLETGVITPTPWDGTVPVFDDMQHIGNTEGAVDPETNPDYSELTLQETSGPAALKRYLTGERPTFSIGIFPDPKNLRLFSPTGLGSAGQRRRRRVREHLLWIVPEELFLGEDENGNTVEVPVTWEDGDFLKDGDPLTEEEEFYVAMSMLIWRADFGRATPRYSHEDGGKSLREVEVTVQQDFTRPDGCQLYLMVGEAALFDIELDGVEPEGPGEP